MYLAGLSIESVLLRCRVWTVQDRGSGEEPWTVMACHRIGGWRGGATDGEKKVDRPATCFELTHRTGK